MKLIFFILFLTLSSASAGLAQMPNDNVANTGISTFEFMNREIFDAVTNAVKNLPKYTTVMSSLKNIPGRGYYTQDWLPGTVVLANGTAKASRGIRYNLALQAIEVRDSSMETGVRVSPAAEIRRFNLGLANQPTGRIFETHVYQNSVESGGRSFFEALNSSGDVRFFLLHQIGKRFSPAKTGTGSNSADVYQKETNLYVLRSGQKKLVEFPLGRKSVLKLFGSRAQAVAEYAASKNLSYDSLPDVVWMAEHYNRLPLTSK